jgi:LDH2 family malate/lactate/ureidoglycolate dehydrogenase
MGRIRNAAAAGEKIPQGWATDRHGADTTDPEAAIGGMLLPAAGPKGFGLAFMIDLLCGGLSGGGIGAEIRPLFGALDQPYGSANLFIAIHVGHFTALPEFSARAGAAVSSVSSVCRAPGVERVFAPGELAYDTRRKADGWCELAQPTVEALRKVGLGLDIDLADLFPQVPEQKSSLR